MPLTEFVNNKERKKERGSTASCFRNSYNYSKRPGYESKKSAHVYLIYHGID